MAKIPAQIEFTEPPTALYRLFGASKLLLYIGVSGSLSLRMRQHAADKPWWPEVRLKTLTWYASRDEALEAEAAAIRAERPVHNLQHAYREPAPVPVPPRPKTIDLGEVAALALDQTLSGTALRVGLLRLGAWPDDEIQAELSISRATWARAVSQLKRHYEILGWRCPHIYTADVRDFIDCECTVAELGPVYVEDVA